MEKVRQNERGRNWKEVKIERERKMNEIDLNYSH